MTINNEDLIALQRYVTGKDSYDAVSPGTIVLDITHSNLKQRHLQIRFNLRDTIDNVRDRIYRQTGTHAPFQYLYFIDCGVTLFEIPPEEESTKMLGYFNLQHGVTVHVVDLDPHSGSRNGAYENTNLIEKYRMTDEDYDKRRGTLREWARQKKSKDESFSLAKHAREHRELMKATRLVKQGLPAPKGFEINRNGKVVRIEDSSELDKCIGDVNSSRLDRRGKDTVEGFKIGMRCEVRPGGRRGSIAFLGEINNLKNGGYWVGVKFDEPVGKSNGCVNDKTYFDAPEGYGGFIRGKNIKIGDFPERDILDELDDSEDEL